MDRDTLNTQLIQSTDKVSNLEKSITDLTKRAELTERNLLNDNRQLRAKLHSLEKESALIHDRCVKIEDVIKEKEKIIASLSIYRYNAIHRKSEGSCKVCIKRIKDEMEHKRREEILCKK